MNKETGGPAFPVNSDNYASPDSTGMTLRDYFAAKAMQGLLACDIDCGPDNVQSIAESSYIMANAMLKAREA
jgi:hypothetical protein